MDKMEIEILSSELITPSNPTPEDLRHYKLSLFDQLAPPSYIRIILCYSAGGVQDTVNHRAERYNQLKSSFSDSLTKFYPLAGRISKDGLSVDCSDQGVEYLEAGVNRELWEILRDGVEIKILDQFMPHDLAKADSTSRPLVAIQINIFKCGGLAIGLCVSHQIADTATLTTFINGWAITNRIGICSMLCPDFDIPSLFPITEDLTMLKPQPLFKNVGAKIVTKRFIFHGTMISKFRTKYKEMVLVNGTTQPSRVTIVTAVIWKALINIARAKHGHFRPSLLVPVMNLRGKVSPTTERSFGNVWMPIIARYMANKSKLELHDLVSILDDAVRQSTQKIKNGSKAEIVLMATNAFKEVVDQKLFNIGMDVFTCTSWSGFPTKEADFGWGKPCWVSSLSRTYEMFTLLDGNFDDGIEALVSLNEKDMIRLDHDVELFIFHFSITIGLP